MKNAKKKLFYNYKGLFEWMFQERLPDKWYVSVNGNAKDELFTLDQIREFHINSPTSRICVLHSYCAKNPKPEWLEYHESKQVDDESTSGAAVLGYIMAVLIPIVGLFIGISLISSDKARCHGVPIIVTSLISPFLVFLVIYLWMTLTS